MKLSTLADVRDLVDKHLPEQYCDASPPGGMWSNEIAKAADGEKDLLEICVNLALGEQILLHGQSAKGFPERG